MPYDEELAERIRSLLDTGDFTEQKMFGGVAFLIGGNMAVAASGQGGLMVRIDRDETDELVAQPHATVMEMRDRPMRGWLRVAAEGVSGEGELRAWVERGVAYARTLPAK